MRVCSSVILRDDGLRFRASSSRPFRTWLATSQSDSSVCLLGCRPSRTRWQRPYSASRARLLFCRGARPSGLTVTGQFRRLWQRRVDDALQSGLSSEVPCRTSLPAIHHCWRRCWDVCNPLSLTCVFANSSDGERAAEDVEERLEAIEASLAPSKPTLNERRRLTGQHVRLGEVVHISSSSDRAPAPVVERLRRRDAAASYLQTAVAAAETLRRHIRTLLLRQQRRRTRILLLRQQRRCGVTLADCCCGSRDVAASHSQFAVAAAETLRRHILSLLLRQQRRCGVTLADRCCGSRDVAASHSQTAVAAAETLRPLKQRWSQRTLPWLAGRWCSLVAQLVRRAAQAS